MYSATQWENSPTDFSIWGGQAFRRGDIGDLVFGLATDAFNPI